MKHNSAYFNAPLLIIDFLQKKSIIKRHKFALFLLSSVFFAILTPLERVTRLKVCFFGFPDKSANKKTPPFMATL